MNIPNKHVMKVSIENGVPKVSIIETLKYQIKKVYLGNEVAFCIELYFEGSLHYAAVWPVQINGEYFYDKNIHEADIFFLRANPSFGWAEKTELEYQTEFKINFGEDKWRFYWEELLKKSLGAFVLTINQFIKV